MTNIYGFCRIESYNNIAKGSLLLDETTRKSYIKHRIGIYVAINTEISINDFYRIEDIPINSATDSFQIRPKVVYKNKKGYYIKEKGSVTYLDDVTVASLEATFDFEVVV